MTPEERQSWRFAYAKDVRIAHERMVQQFHAEVAENRLAHEGIKPELARYVEGIGEASR